MPSIDGLISGLDTTGIIKDLLSFQRRPIDQLRARIQQETGRRTAILGFTAKLLGLQTKANQLINAASFKTPSVATTNDDVLTAQGGENLPTGSYTFRVAQLAEGSQHLSGGFSAIDALVGAGTLKIDSSGGAIDRKTEVDLLNGGAGLRRGSIRITDRSGSSKVIDLSVVLTVDDVITAINNTSGLAITARISGTGNARPGEAILLTDSSGGTGDLKVEEVFGGNTASDLGLLSTVSADTLEGTSVVQLGSNLSLLALNDGLGVRQAAGGDLSIVQRDGTTFTVDLNGADTVGEVITAINDAAGNTSVTVAISGRKLVATDTSVGGSTFSISNVTTGSSATDLGLTEAAAGGTITGSEILADFNSVLLKNLQGGSGVAQGSITITNRAGAAETLDLSSARTIQDVIRTINTNSISVTASLNDVGDGLRLTDSSGGSGVFKVEEVAATTAADLGILNVTGVSANQIIGNDVVISYISENTRLSTLNGGRGVFAGSITITDPSNRSFTVDLSQEVTIGDVLIDINGAAALVGSDVVASINSTGNGIILTAATGGAVLKVSEESGGSTAKDLGIAGTAASATPRTIDGSFETSVTISAEDTLETLVDKINSLEIGVTASILNDGSSLNPFRLQLVSNQPGAKGRAVVRTETTGLEFSTTASGKDAILFYGGDGAQPVVIRSSTNKFSEIINGLTLNARSVSSSSVVVTATRDLARVETAIEELAESYNEVIDEIRALTSFNVETGERGILLGDGALRSTERELADALIRPILGLSSGSNLASQIGLRIQSNGKIFFDRSEFNSLAASDPDAIKRLFTHARALELTTLLVDFGNGAGIRTTTSGADIKISKRDGTTLEVDLTGDKTLRDLLSSINNATGNGGTVTASISSDGRSIVLVDSTSGTTAFEVDSINGSSAHSKLGLDLGADSPGGGTITGRDIDLTSDPGLARRLFDTLEELVNTDGGLFQTRADLFQALIADLEEQVEDKEGRLLVKEASLRRQFAQLEVLLGKNQGIQQRLTAVLSSLP